MKIESPEKTRLLSPIRFFFGVPETQFLLEFRCFCFLFTSWYSIVFV